MSLMLQFHTYVANADLPKGIKQELNTLFSANLSKPYSRTRHSAAPLGIKTQSSRVVNLLAMLTELIKAKFEITSVYSIREKHVEFLIKKWIDEGQEKGTIENKITYLGTLASWTKRPNVVKKSSQYPILNTLKKRTGITFDDKSWTAAGINVEEVIEQIAKDNVIIGMQLSLIVMFGLRVEEALLLRPFNALTLEGGSYYVTIENGTKGGRRRKVEMHNVEKQIEVLELAKKFVNGKSNTMIPLEFSLKRWKAKFYNTLVKHGLQKEGKYGVTAHGLRHQYLNDLFRHIAKTDSPVRGGEAPAPDMLRFARQSVTEAAGHSRESKANAYIGSYRAMAVKTAQDLKDDEILAKIKDCGGNKMKAAEELGCSRSYLYKRLQFIDLLR
ncbi:integrase domain-containing protein [Undibacterium sp. LX40W]|uniref:Integrase domain-containing protein n=1 Tax=Undibacterium nitidum TaxID=2762298 RepID=A0A923KL88_9BURK|nr:MULTISPECIES: integrase domain-containing protein [Undibacterium]MBC3881580.1 integrase domain-containing protein [Undibacterium nitidum]MBC3891638.1 integrase domain-containing protein [Undibacterium sp. LX40W]